MISFVLHNDIDKARWDRCIRDAFNGNIYAWSWYLDIVHKNWNALIEDDYVRVFPLTGNVRFGVFYLFQPFFAQQLGIFSVKNLSPAITDSFIKAIPSFFRLVEIRLNTHNLTSMPAKNVSWHTNYELDLISNYKLLYQKYNTNTKRNLKKAQEAHLTIVANISPIDIINLFRNHRGRTISHWNDFEYRRLQNLIFNIINHGMATTIGAYTEQNELCAGAIFVKSHQRLTFLFSGASAIGKEKNAMTLLIDYVIQQTAGNLLVLDFEGSDNPNLARFYKGFGSHPVSYPGIMINRLPLPLKLAFNLIRYIKRPKKAKKRKT